MEGRYEPQDMWGTGQSPVFRNERPAQPFDSAQGRLLRLRSGQARWTWFRVERGAGFYRVFTQPEFAFDHSY